MNLRCKSCGKINDVTEKEAVAKCISCDEYITLPKLNDKRKTNIYNLATHHLQNGEFDKAIALYESLLIDDSTDAEIYWSILLCKYGVRYVNDSISGKRVLTCNRTQMTSIYADENYTKVIQYANQASSPLYLEEALQINKIQQQILMISQQEEPYDIFICYKETDENGKRTEDSVLAQDLYYQLTDTGYNVFFAKITLENKLGSEYESVIFSALNSSKVMIVVGTKKEYFEAPWVKNEWSRYLTLIKNGSKKVIIPAYKGIDAYHLPQEFANLQAQEMSRLGFMHDLIRGIEKIVQKADSITENTRINQTQHTSSEVPRIDRIKLFLENGEFALAKNDCDKELEENPDNSQLYVYKLMIDLKVKNEFDLGNQTINFEDNLNYINAFKFGNELQKTRLNDYLKLSHESIDYFLKSEYQALSKFLCETEGKYQERIDYFKRFNKNIEFYYQYRGFESLLKAYKSETVHDNPFHWYEKSANAGNVWGMFGLAKCYWEGVGVEKNYQKAIELFYKAANDGKKVGVGHNVFKYFSLAAMSGNVYGMFELGKCYWNGIGIVKSDQNAVEWFDKATKVGRKEGFPQKMFEWYREAAMLKNANGMKNLGDCYYYGNGTRKDYTQAYYWYNEAINMGNAYGINSDRIKIFRTTRFIMDNIGWLISFAISIILFTGSYSLFDKWIQSDTLTILNAISAPLLFLSFVIYFKVDSKYSPRIYLRIAFIYFAVVFMTFAIREWFWWIAVLIVIVVYMLLSFVKFLIFILKNLLF